MTSAQKLSMLLADLEKMGLLERIEEHIVNGDQMSDELKQHFNDFMNGKTKIGGKEFEMGFLSVLLEEVNVLLP